MRFEDGEIAGVIVRPLTRYSDNRGWLIELFRHDELNVEHYPVMAYVSLTYPAIVRGPHEHRDQTDLFGFVGPSTFKVYMWDARQDSPTYGKRQIVVAGEENPTVVIVPPGVVHAYKNVGNLPGYVFNAPNRLYRGWKRAEPVDEIRHEDDPNSPFVVD